MDELRKELDALAALMGTFFDDACKLIDQAVETLDRLTEDQADDDQCLWRRAQIRSAHGDLTDYGRRCALEADHGGDHQVPKAAKQSNTGVWYNPYTGETFTQ